MQKWDFNIVRKCFECALVCAVQGKRQHLAYFYKENNIEYILVHWILCILHWLNTIVCACTDSTYVYNVD